MNETKQGWPADAHLRKFYLAIARPALAKRMSRGGLQVYDSALRRFERFAGGSPTLGSVDAGLLAEFARWLPSRRTAKTYAKHLVACIRNIVRVWNADAFRPTVPAAAPGTLRHYFETVYVPERMSDCKPHSIAKSLRALVALRKFHGDDPRLDELTDDLAARFFQSLRDRGMPATTVNSGYRACLFAPWNLACDRALVARGPRIKKFKERRAEPDSWTAAEFARLVAAARRFQPGQCYGELPRADFWTALLLVAWCTALRRGSLLAIRQENIDLQRGSLYVPGDAMKNRQAQAFQLAPEAVEAIGHIWLPERELLFGGVSFHFLNRHFGLLIDAADVPRSRHRGRNKFHRIRRTTATLVCARAGVSAASALLGHSDQYVTKRYLDPRVAARHDVTNLLPALPAAG